MARLGESPDIRCQAEVHADARIGRALLDGQVRVEAGAVVAESVLSRGAVVCRGARVIRSVLPGRVEARAGETVGDEFRAG
jgi:ADP-glucose pyrophosphorylase